MCQKTELSGLFPEEIHEKIKDYDRNKFRGLQIFKWINSGVDNFDKMTNLSAGLKEFLNSNFYISYNKIINKLISKNDGTVKYLFQTLDNAYIESVAMKYTYGYSVCISSQSGCKMGCKFCASSELPFIKDLSSGEMLSQVINISRDLEQRVGHVVIMGIGEPLDNYDNVIKFIRLLNHKDGLNIGMRNISLSTCGIIPEILKLSKENMQITLSVSLHAPNDTIREQIMPVNKAYPVKDLINACRKYITETGRRITFEYILIDGVNNSTDAAEELALLLKGMMCHVNLIPYNKIQNNVYNPGKNERIFMEKLSKRGVEATVRRTMGNDINGACGQLRAEGSSSFCK